MSYAQAWFPGLVLLWQCGVVGDGVVVVSGLVCFLPALLLWCRWWLVVCVFVEAGGVGVGAFHVASPFAGASHVFLGQSVVLQDGAFDG